MRGVIALVTLSFAVSLGGQTRPDFTGHWRQKTNSGTQRDLDVKQNGASLSVKTAVTNSQGTRSLDVNYEIGGSETNYTGMDGDQFRSSVHWDGNTLLFDIREQENGSEIPQKTVWALSQDGNTLQVDRTMTKSGRTSHSLSTYTRQP
jgi:hypothetical protein